MTTTESRPPSAASIASRCSGRNDAKPQCRARTSSSLVFAVSFMTTEAPSVRGEMQAFYIRWRTSVADRARTAGVKQPHASTRPSREQRTAARTDDEEVAVGLSEACRHREPCPAAVVAAFDRIRTAVVDAAVRRRIEGEKDRLSTGGGGEWRPIRAAVG